MTKEEAIKYLQQLYPSGGHCWLDEQRIEAIGMAIDALKEEPVSEDLEEAIDNALVFEEKTFVYDDPETKEGMEEVYTREQAIEIFVAAAQWQKQQMMKDAVGLKINRSTLYDLKPIIHERYQDFKIGDKVKLIIIKDE